MHYWEHLIFGYYGAVNNSLLVWCIVLIHKNMFFSLDKCIFPAKLATFAKTKNTTLVWLQYWRNSLPIDSNCTVD